MKKVKPILTIAVCAAVFTSTIFAAPKAKSPKDIWVSSEKNGTLMTTNNDGWASFDLDEEFDLAGYKYLQIECSSPDSKKVGIVSFDARYGEEDDDTGRPPKSATVQIKTIGKKAANYQGLVYGVSRQFYDAWIEGKLEIRKPEETLIDRLDVMTFDANWGAVPGIKIYVKKITATNTPVGQVHEIDLSEFGFLAFQKEEWDDKSIHYVCNVEIDDKLNGGLKAGDLVKFTLNGKAMSNLGGFEANLIDTSSGWIQLSQQLDHQGYAKGQDIDETWEFIASLPAQKVSLFIYTADNKTKGPALINFEE